MIDYNDDLPPMPPEVHRAYVAWNRALQHTLPPEVRKFFDQYKPVAPRRDMMREWAERLDRARQFDQSKMPPWKDPRG